MEGLKKLPAPKATGKAEGRAGERSERYPPEVSRYRPPALKGYLFLCLVTY